MIGAELRGNDAGMVELGIFGLAEADEKVRTGTELCLTMVATTAEESMPPER